VAVHIVDGLEEVDVEEEEPERIAGPAGTDDPLVDAPLHGGAAEGAGQGIGEAGVHRPAVRPSHGFNSTEQHARFR
jgi:hypothetical protein